MKGEMREWLRASDWGGMTPPRLDQHYWHYIERITIRLLDPG